MKKVISTIYLLGLVTFILSGCGGSAGTGTSGSAGSSLCTDESILSKLKNDDSPEFVLEGVYYALPVSAEELVKNGWTLIVEKYEGQEVMLQPMERVKVTFTKDNDKIDAILANDSELPLEAEKSNVFQVSCTSHDKTSDFLVTKYGITCATSAKDAKAVLKDVEGFEESSFGYKLTSNGEFGAGDPLYFRTNADYTAIEIASAEEWVYSQYKPTEVKEQEQADNIAAYKENAGQNCPENYDDIVKEIEDATTLHTVPFCSINGTVVTRTTGNYEKEEGDLLASFYDADLFLYVVQDKSGQIYCIFEGAETSNNILKLPELAEGDVISVWGFASKYTVFEDGSKAPTIIPEIVEKDGEIIYLSDGL